MPLRADFRHPTAPRERVGTRRSRVWLGMLAAAVGWLGFRGEAIPHHAAAISPAYGWLQLQAGTPGDDNPADYPLARMAEDPGRHRLVLWGTDDARDYTLHTWTWDELTHQWSGGQGTSPVLYGVIAPLAFDGQQVMLVGSTDRRDPCSTQTWLWNGATWDRVPGSGPPRISGAYTPPAMAYDPLHRNVVLFGGAECGPSGNGTAIPDTATWIWDGKTRQWTARHPSLSPPGTWQGGMAFDGREVVMFGGETLSSRGAPGTFSSTTWTWDGNSWARFDLPGPEPRRDLGMAYDPGIDQVVVFGGTQHVPAAVDVADVAPSPPTTWGWSGATHTWTLLAAATMPQPRVGPALATDSHDSAVVMYGGRGGTTSGFPLADTWISSVPRGAVTVDLSSAPNPSREHESVEFDAVIQAPLDSRTPTGSVLFRDGLADLGTAPVAGDRARLRTGALPIGLHQITAFYPGDRNFLPGVSQPLLQQVIGVGRPSPGQPLIEDVQPPCGSSSQPTPVRITGVALDGTTAVRFGNQQTTGLTVTGSGTTILTTAPPQPLGVVGVEVTTGHGVGGGATFTYAATCRTVGAVPADPSSRPSAALSSAVQLAQGSHGGLAGGVTASSGSQPPAPPGGTAAQLPVPVAMVQPAPMGNPGTLVGVRRERRPEVAPDRIHSMVSGGLRPDSSACLLAAASVTACLAAACAIPSRRRSGRVRAAVRAAV